MDFSSAAASPEVFMSQQEVVDEIAFQKTMLATIDDSVQDREEAEALVKAEIRRLERLLRALRGDQHKPTSATSMGSQPPAATLLHSKDSNFNSSDPFGLPSATNASRNQFSSTSSTPNSGVSSSHPNLLSPSLPTRKRPLDGNHDHGSGSKSRRTSPSPHATRSSTPVSVSGYDYHTLDNGYYDLTNDDEGSRKLLQRQKAAEEKASQERADAELARTLATKSGYPMASEPANSHTLSQNGGVSAYDRLLGRSTSKGQHTFGQPSSSKNSLAQSAQHNTASTQVFGTNSHASFPQARTSAIKPEPQSLSRLSMPGAFPREYTSDSDSSIELISASAFQDNGRRHPFSPSKTDQSGSAARAPVGSMYTAGAHLDTALNHTLNPHLPYTTQYYASQNRHGVSLPTPSGMAMQQPGGQILGYSPYSQTPGALGSGVYGNAQVLGLDPLRDMIRRTQGIDWTTMTDGYGNPLDSRLNDISDYINDPRKTQQEIQDLLENIRPDEEIPKEDREGTPDGLKYPLYEHQKLALTWLKNMEEGTNKGGILADDMGLGKTISALALILSRPSTDRTRRTTLIVGPVALVRQWEREIQTKINRSHRLSTFLFHSARKATWDVLRSFDIVLTTYGTIGAEYKRLEQWHEKLKDNPDMDQSGYKKRFSFLGDLSKWYRVILDEAQCIKNKGTNAAKGCARLKSVYRFCLTGTPMMNGVHELYSLIHFLRIRPYNDYTTFQSNFGILTKSNGGARHHIQAEKNAMKKLQAVLKAILLRRNKTSMIDGKAILTLPEKTEEVVHAVFDEDEQAYYTALETKAKLQFNKYVKAGTIGKNYSNILVLLLRLRQAACHPHLIMDFEEAPVEATLDDMITLAKGLLPDVIRRIIDATVPFECPVCYDPVPNPRIVIPCGHDTCAACLVRISGNAEQEGIVNGIENAQGAAKCPTCRGKIDNAKIIDYETFKQVHMKGKVAASNVDDDETESEDDNESIDYDSSDSDSDTESDTDSDGDIRGFVVPDDYVSEGEYSEAEEDGDDDATQSEDDGADAKVKKPTFKSDVKKEVGSFKQESRIKREVKDEDSDDDDFVDIKDIKAVKIEKKVNAKATKALKSKPAKKERAPRKPKKKSRKGKGKGKGKGNEKEAVKQHMSLAMLKKDAMRSAEGRRRYMKYLRKHWVSSAKVSKCLEILQNTKEGVKTIIFSQFTTLLDLVEVPLRKQRVGVARYDGSMSADSRHASVVNFTDDASVHVMLVSLKAGNAGLNLVAASQVIILDPFWNPFVEMQAVDRAHRIGQQKPVTVHRILVKGTVEDRIIDLQNKKRKVIEAALDEKASAGLGRLGREELVYLFNGGNGEQRQTLARPALTFGAGPLDSPSPTPSGSTP